MDGYLDGELDLVRSLELERHSTECPGCARFLEQRTALRAAMRATAPRYSAPAGLRKRVGAALAKQDRTKQDRLEQPRSSFRIPWQAVAAMAVGVAALAILWRRPVDNEIEREVVSSHVRSLMGAHLTDVPSTDQHTVKPWFAGKLDFSPPVNDFSAEGFKLTGGRLDYLDNRPVAALVYLRGKHVINVFVWPSADKDLKLPARTGEYQGYNVIERISGGMTYWLVSDLNREELRQFAERLAGR